MLPSKARSEPRHTAGSSFLHISYSDHPYIENDRACHRNLPKSAPDHPKPGAARKVRHGLKPVNLFPEWTRDRQRVTNEKPACGKTCCLQGCDKLHLSGDIAVNDVVHRSHQQYRKMSSTSKAPLHIGNQLESLPKTIFLGSTSHDHVIERPRVIQNLPLEGTRASRSIERKGQYWFNDNTIRRLSALDPSVFHSRRILEGRNSLVGVKQAKSVDIASIYSSKPYENLNSKVSNPRGNKDHFEGHQTSHTSKGHGFRSPAEINFAHRNDQALTQKATNNQHQKQTTYLQTQAPTNKIIKQAAISIEDHGIPEEEFRPAPLVLQDLYYSPHEQQRPRDPSTKRYNIGRMSVPEKIPVQYDAEKQVHKASSRQSLSETAKFHTSTDKEPRSKMTQEKIRENIERNRRRFRMSLPDQAMFIERQNCMAKNGKPGRFKQNLYETTEDKPEVGKPKTSNGMDQNGKAMPKREESKEGSPKRTKEVRFIVGGDQNQKPRAIIQVKIPNSCSKKMVPTRRFDHGEYFRHLDAAVSRRHTIHFGNNQEDVLRQISSHPSVETLPSGYRSLERNERRMGQQTGNVPPKIDHPLNQEKTIASKSSKNYQHSPKEKTPLQSQCKVNKTIALPRGNFISPTQDPYQHRNGQHQEKAVEQPKELLTYGNDNPPTRPPFQTSNYRQPKELLTYGFDNPPTRPPFQTSKYKPVPGPDTFWKSKTKGPLKSQETVADSASRSESSTPRDSRWLSVPSQASRRQTIGGVQTQHELQVIFTYSIFFPI